MSRASRALSRASAALPPWVTASRRAVGRPGRGRQPSRRSRAAAPRATAAGRPRADPPPAGLLGRPGLGRRPVQLRLPGPLLGRRPQRRPPPSPPPRRRPAGRPARPPGTACTGRPAPGPPRTRPAGRRRRPVRPRRPFSRTASAGRRRTAAGRSGSTHRIAPRPNTSARASTSVDSPDRLLRRHVRRRAEHAPGLRRAVRVASRADLGRRRSASGSVRRPGPPPVRQDLGQAPVHDLDLAEGPDHDVGRLQVPVDDPVGVGVRRPPGRPARRRPRTGRGRPPGRRPASRSSRVRPLISFMARNGRPSGRVPTSWTGGMPGCWSWPVIRASSRNRRAAGRVGRVPVLEHLDGHVPVEGRGRGPGRRRPCRRGRSRRGARTGRHGRGGGRPAWRQPARRGWWSLACGRRSARRRPGRAANRW